MYDYFKPRSLDLLAGGRRHVPSHIQTFRLCCIPVYPCLSLCTQASPQDRQGDQLSFQADLGDQLNFQLLTFLSLAAESQRQGCSWKPGHSGRGCAGRTSPECWGMAQRSRRAWKALGPGDPPADRAAPALSSPGNAAAGQHGESTGEAPQEGNGEWKARVERQDEALRY